jgi:uncharacterized protein YbaR (Trm112 family)
VETEVKDLNIFDEEETVEPPDDLKEGFTAEVDPASRLKDARAYEKVEAEDIIKSSLNRQITELGRKTAKALENSPKHKVMIPENKLSPEDTFVVAAINGWTFQIKRGVPVLLPDEIINLLADGGYTPTLVR